MPVAPLPIITSYDVERFKQFSPQDCANWYIVENKNGKRPQALYPTMGRRHINTAGINRLIFAEEPRGLFKSDNVAYVVVSSNIYKLDADFNETKISNSSFTTNAGMVNFAYLPTPSTTYAAFVDGQRMFVYNEATGSFQQVTDANLPANPTYIAAFGNRFVVAGRDTTEFRLSTVNLSGSASNWFTISGSAVFAQEAGIIQQMGVLHNTLFIFTRFTTGLWSNIPSTFQNATFPWKKNTSYDWDYGIADPKTLSIDFGLMTFMGRSRNGRVQIMTSTGEYPKPISTRAIDLLFQRNRETREPSPYLQGNTDGFLYEWDKTIFYRLSCGDYTGTELVDHVNTTNSVEFNFNTETWHRVIELNGERNRIQKHVYFEGCHLASIKNEGTVYEMAGDVYTNEVRNAEQPNPQAVDAYTKKPFRYVLVTPILSEPDYSESLWDYVQIDFVWGEDTSIYSDAPFQNTTFIIDEEPDSDGNPIYLIDEQMGQDGQPVFLITEDGNTPTVGDTTYNDLFKPHVELYWSDNGGIMYYPANVLQFSDIGYYEWLMRWYQLSPSRNRTFKLVCVSESPMVILGAVGNKRRASGGAN